MAERAPDVRGGVSVSIRASSVAGQRPGSDTKGAAADSEGSGLEFRYRGKDEEHAGARRHRARKTPSRIRCNLKYVVVGHPRRFVLESVN